MSDNVILSGQQLKEADAHRGTEMTPVVVIALSAILFMPGGVFFIGETSSMSPGVLLAAITILTMRIVAVPGMQRLGGFGGNLMLGLLVVVLLAAHLFVRSLAVEIDTAKATGSLVIALLAVLAGGTVGALLDVAPDPVIRRAVFAMMAVFLVSALFSLLSIEPLSSTATSKPIFPFTEPSLFAGALLPVIAFLGVTGQGWQRWVWIITGFALGYLLRNLSLVIGSTVVTVVCLKTTRLVAFGAAATLLVPLLKLSYFVDRLELDPTKTTNLSSLVYIQGWEMIGAATRATWGWGLGFQQLGFIFLDAPTSNLINRLTGGTDLNLKEGSFAASKLISELGIFGAGLIVCHAYLALRAFFVLRRVAVAAEIVPLGEVLAMCSIYTFIIEMYVRGAGYFSSPTMLLVSSLFLLARVRRRRLFKRYDVK